MKKTYAYHKPSAESLEKIKQIREAVSSLHDLFDKNCPPSRELSLAITKLEETNMWAVKAVVCNDPASEVSDS